MAPAAVDESSDSLLLQQDEECIAHARPSFYWWETAMKYPQGEEPEESEESGTLEEYEESEILEEYEEFELPEEYEESEYKDLEETNNSDRQHHSPSHRSELSDADGEYEDEDTYAVPLDGMSLEVLPLNVQANSSSHKAQVQTPLSTSPGTSTSTAPEPTACTLKFKPWSPTRELNKSKQARRKPQNSTAMPNSEGNTKTSAAMAEAKAEKATTSVADEAVSKDVSGGAKESVDAKIAAPTVEANSASKDISAREMKGADAMEASQTVKESFASEDMANGTIESGDKMVAASTVKANVASKDSRDGEIGKAVEAKATSNSEATSDRGEKMTGAGSFTCQGSGSGTEKQTAPAGLEKKVTPHQGPYSDLNKGKQRPSLTGCPFPPSKMKDLLDSSPHPLSKEQPPKEITTVSSDSSSDSSEEDTNHNSDQESAHIPPAESIFGDGKKFHKRKEIDEDSGEHEAKKAKREATQETENFGSDNAEIIALLVGQQEIVVLAEESKLIKVSDYFCGAMSGDFRESAMRVLTFPDEVPQTLNSFLTWIYTGHKQLPGNRHNMKDMACMRLYCFAEVVQCIKLQNMMIQQLYSTMKEHVGPRASPRFDILIGYVNPEAIKYALRRMPPENPLITLIVWYFVVFGNEKRLKDANLSMKRYPESFRIAILDEMYGAGGAQAIKKQLPPLEKFLRPTMRRR